MELITETPVQPKDTVPQKDTFVRKIKNFFDSFKTPQNDPLPPSTLEQALPWLKRPPIK